MHFRMVRVFSVIKRSFASDARIGIVSVPFDKGQERKGVAGGPDAIKKFGLLQQLKEIGNVCIDLIKQPA